MQTGVILSLLDTCDVLVLQETMLVESMHHILDNLNDDFMTFSVPASRDDSCFFGRSSGGLAVFVRKLANISFNQIFFSRRFQGIKMVCTGKTFLLVNMYAPCDYRNSESFIEYISTLCELSNFLNQEHFDDVLLCGDFNCDPNKGRFFKLFMDFANRHSLICYDIMNLPRSSYTYVSSNSYCSTSWLDHLLVSNSSLVAEFTILYDFALEDHVPIYFEMCIPDKIQMVENTNSSDSRYLFVQWDRASSEEKSLYKESLDYFVSNLNFESLSCSQSNCNDEGHKNELDMIYEYMIDAVKVSSMNLPTRTRNVKFKVIAGWNDHCKELHTRARNKFLLWRRSGSNRSGPIFEDMKSSRSDFKKALKFCRDNELRLKRNKLLETFSISNRRCFWKFVSKITKSNRSAPSSHIIDNTSDINGILEIFDSNYKSILDDPFCQSGPQTENSAGSENHVNVFSLTNLNRAIGCLKTNLGWDFIHSNHVMLSGTHFRRFLCKLFSKFVSHCHMPVEILKGEIRPILKNNSLSKSSSTNYRPIMNSSVFLKIFEYCLLPILERDLKLDDRQFGFRSGTGCTTAVSVLKETIHSYLNQGSVVHCAMVDLTKAFDKVNYNILVEKLRHTILPLSIVNILNFMFRNIFVSVKYQGSSSDEWLQGNGVRQGGVLSALLFNFYISSTISSISQLNAGCSLSLTKTSIISYADDISLLAPSASGLQILIDALFEKISKLGLVINPSKSCYLVFRKSRRVAIDTRVYLNGRELERTSECLYLGIMLSDICDVEIDSNRVLTSFLKQFNSLFSKFNFVDRNVLFYLFKSYATSLYGIETWFSDNVKKNSFYKLAVAYHKAIKRMVGLNVWDSNHQACALSSLPIFKHLLAKRAVAFYRSLVNSKSPCVASLKYFYRTNACFAKNLRNLFSAVYEIDDILDNPLCCLYSRIDYVQRT